MQSTTEHDLLIPRVMDVSVRIGLGILLAFICFQIVRPFLAPIVWGIIIAIGCYPGFRRLEQRLGGRSGLAAALFSLMLLVILILPTIHLSDAMVVSAKALSADLADGTLSIPPPPERVAGWPIIGERLSEAWSLAANNLSSALARFEPQLKVFGGWLLGASARAAFGLVLFVFSIIIAGVFLANWNACAAAAEMVATRLLGRRGPKLVKLSHATILSVTRGIIGIALAQAILAGLGFLAIELPAAGLWAIVCLILAIVQIDILIILIPLSIYAFSFAGTGAAVAFLVWNIAVGLMNNVLKPILMGRGVDAPMVVVFIGAIGGLMATGVIGLFVGAVLLVLGFKLFVAWIKDDDELDDSDAPIDADAKASA